MTQFLEKLAIGSYHLAHLEKLRGMLVQGTLATLRRMAAAHPTGVHVGQLRDCGKPVAECGLTDEQKLDRDAARTRETLMGLMDGYVSLETAAAELTVKHLERMA